MGHINVHPYVLLTGAGFTHNFGAPLAADVWALLLSHPEIRQNREVHKLFKRNFDFEDVYHSVLSEDRFTRQQRSAILRAVRDVYEYIDTIVCRYRLNGSAPTHDGVQQLLRLFVGSEGRPGFIFTLNQDIFLERHFGHMLGQIPHVPLATPQSNSSWAQQASLFDFQIVLPEDGPLEMPSLADSPLYYVKLHGSCNWYSQAGRDVMVIGREKEHAIAGNALLNLYGMIFRRVLTEGAQRVLCIGYSFRDQHINDVLADGAAAGLRIMILSPDSPVHNREHIVSQHRGGDLGSCRRVFLV